MSSVNLMLGDSAQKLKELADNSVDSIVCDPPYGLSFMGKKWDYDVPNEGLWKEALRVLKPGGHLLAFFGTRTYHRGVVKIEDAGFEIRDQVMWLYGSGFPKSTNVALRIDKENGSVKTRGGKKMKMGHGDSGITKPSTGSKPFPTYQSNSNESKQWQGWGTALKPANEPIVVARKPLEKGLTIAENVLKWGTGALNIDGTRIEAKSEKDLKELRSERPSKTSNANDYSLNHGGLEGLDRSDRSHITGRWPANLLLDEVAAESLDLQTSDNVSRFFYVAKASKRERGEGNNHPTVKPIKLMEYLIKLVTPPQGTVLDPFMGSGSTGVAAKRLGFSFVGCEMNEEYLEIAKRRIEAANALSAQDESAEAEL